MWKSASVAVWDGCGCGYFTVSFALNNDSAATAAMRTSYPLVAVRQSCDALISEVTLCLDPRLPPSLPLLPPPTTIRTQIRLMKSYILKFVFGSESSRHHGFVHLHIWPIVLWDSGGRLGRPWHARPTTSYKWIPESRHWWAGRLLAAQRAGQNPKLAFIFTHFTYIVFFSINPLCQPLKSN